MMNAEMAHEAAKVAFARVDDDISTVVSRRLSHPTELISHNINKYRVSATTYLGHPCII